MYSRTLLILIVLLLCSPLVGQEAKLRTWTSSGGNYSIEARMVKSDETHVTLKKADGKTMRIEIARLSAADQKYIKSKSATKPGGTGKATPSNSRFMNVRNATEVKMESPVAWSLTADPAKPVQLSSEARFEIPDFPENKQNELFLMDPSGSQMIYAHQGFSGREAVTGYAYDLKTGKQLGKKFNLGGTFPLALSPSLQNMMVLMENNEVAWISMKSGRMSQKLRWTPYVANGPAGTPRIKRCSRCHVDKLTPSTSQDL